MGHFEDAKDLVKHSKAFLPKLILLHDKSLAKHAIEPALLIEIKNLMENLRSALDYSAHGVFAKYGHSSKPNPQIYFPYVGIGKAKVDFIKRFEVCMPGVAAVNPTVVDMVGTYQPFAGENNNWLPLFMNLNNSNKHQQLTPQKAVQKRGIKLSEGKYTLVCKALIITGGGKVIIGGKEVPEGHYTADNLPPVSEPGQAEAVTWQSLHFSSNNEEVLPFLKNAVERIEAIVGNMAVL